MVEGLKESHSADVFDKLQAIVERWHDSDRKKEDHSGEQEQQAVLGDQYQREPRVIRLYLIDEKDE